MDLDANSLLMSLLVSCVGFVCFSYGRRQRRVPQIAAGVTLMVYPYFVSNLLVMAGIGVAILVLMTVAVRMGV